MITIASWNDGATFADEGRLELTLGCDGIETVVGTRVSISIDLGSGGKIAPDRIALLEAIQAQKSISGAARSLGMSYRWAWLWVEAINKALRAPAVATKAGGRNGGGAALTPVGRELVGLYRAIEGHANVAAVTECGALHRLARSEKMPAGASAV